MKRKLLLALLTIIMTVTCAIGFSACERHTHTMTHHPATAATCTEDGNVEYWSCSGCGKNFADEDGDKEITTIVIPATGHTYSEEWTTDGDYHWHAATCGHDEEVKDRAEHAWDSGEITTEPTCTEPGVKTYTCTVCDAAKTETVSATGHTYSDKWSYDEDYHWHAATCEHTNEVGNKAEHSWNNGVITAEPTCTETGTKTYTCTVCDAAKIETVSATGHTYSDKWSYDEDYHWHAATCGHNEETKDKAEHAWDSGEITTEPTCTEPGVKTYTCTVCDATKTETVSATGHTYSDKWSYDEDYHWYAATCGHNEETKDKAEHTLVDGLCTVCDAFIGTKGLEYTLSDDETYYIVSGIGTASDTDIIIPDAYNGKPVTEIGSQAFYQNQTIQSVAIPDSVTAIGSFAFCKCESLTDVTIGGGVETIEKQAFAKCASLENVVIADGVAMIGEIMFWECPLTKIIIPDSVTSIGANAFRDCASLSDVTIGSGVETIGSRAFYGCPIESAVVSASAMDNYMQENGTLPGDASYLIAPGYLKTLILTGEGEMADFLLFGYNQLETVIICDGITSIGSYAFSRCISLKSIVIPDSVLSIGSSVADDCDVLEAVYYGGTESDWNSMDIASGNTKLTDIARYYYSETRPTEEGNFWHYDTDGVTPVIWKDETSN